MERFNALSRGMQLMFGASLLLIIDSFLAWQKYTGEGADQIEAAGGDISRNMWHGWGVLAVILTIALAAWLGARVADAKITLPVSDAMVAAALAILILLFTVIKFLADDTFRAYGAWIGLLLAIVIMVGAYLAVQEAGGVQTLKTEAAGMTSGGGAASAPSAPPPAASPPPPAPAAPAEPHDHSSHEGHTHEEDRPA